MSTNTKSSAPQGVQLWLMLWKATRQQEANALRSIGKTGLCLSDFGVLEALLHKGPMPVNTLGKTILISSGSMTAAIDRLEAQGFVERRDSPTDRRARIAHLTPSGRAFIKPLFAAHARDLEEAFAHLTKSDRVTLAALLLKLSHHERKSS